MSKTKTITISNLKALRDISADFNGCTAIITGGNNKGKSTFLRSITDRIRGEKPDLIVKQGEKEGKGIIELTTGEKFLWEFDVDGKDKLTFSTKEGYKSKVTQEIAKKFFPPLFDIDTFISSAPKQQSLMLQKLVGLDFSAIDFEYQEAYNQRTALNKIAEADKLKLESFTPIPEKVEATDSAKLLKEKEEIRNRLNQLYLDNKKANDEMRDKYNKDVDSAKNEILIHNSEQERKAKAIESAEQLLEGLQDLGYIGSEVKLFIDKLQADTLPPKRYQELPQPPYITPELPDSSEIAAIDLKIAEVNDINAKAKLYADYQAVLIFVESSKADASNADVKVKDIQIRKEEIIKAAKMPDGFTITDDGILIDGLPLNQNQISTSKYYCAALRLASLGLGEVKTLYFDASPLDNITLKEIEDWANKNDLQLLIEMVDKQGGEINYELIENK
jgi:hypothetical protein